MTTTIVTGGRGFIGSHLLLSLSRNFPRARFISLDAETYAARMPLYVKKPDNIIEEKVDIRDQLSLSRVYKKYEPDTTIHLAAESHVCRSITGPKDFATTNFMGTFNVLEEHRAVRARRLLYVSTDEVFGEAKESSFNENSPLAPRSPYAATKAAGDMLVKSYFHTYGMNVVIVNMSNNFGPNQHEEKLVPRTITHLLKGLPVIVHGDGKNKRDWIFVKDAVHGITNAMLYGRNGERYCLGDGTELTNLEMIHKLHNLVSAVAGPVELKLKHTKDRPTDDCRYFIEGSKAAEELEWRADTAAFENQLKTTVEWYVRGHLGRN